MCLRRFFMFLHTQTATGMICSPGILKFWLMREVQKSYTFTMNFIPGGK